MRRYLHINVILCLAVAISGSAFATDITTDSAAPVRSSRRDAKTKTDDSEHSSDSNIVRDLLRRLNRQLNDNSDATAEDRDGLVAETETRLETAKELPDNMRQVITIAIGRLNLKQAEANAIKGRMDESNQECDKGIAQLQLYQDELDAKTRLLFATALHRRNDTTEAERQIEICMQPDAPARERAEACYRRALWLDKNSKANRDRAMQLHKEAIKFYPMFLSPYFAVANLLEEKDERTKALDYRKLALKEHDYIKKVIRYLRVTLPEKTPSNQSIHLLSSELAGHLSQVLNTCIAPNTSMVIRMSTTNTTFQFKFVPPGEYTIGFSAAQRESAMKRARAPGFGYNARYQHTIKVEEGFFILDREITNAQWGAVEPENGSDGPDPEVPHINVNWAEAMFFCRNLGQLVGMECRLPYEVEWEVAARPNPDWVYPWGNEHGRANGKSSSLQPVDLSTTDRTPSEIYDFAGNVSEWCADTYKNLLFPENPKSISWNPSARKYPRVEKSEQEYFTRNDEGMKQPLSGLRSIRGGRYSANASTALIPSRQTKPVSVKTSDIGFRPVVMLRKPLPAPKRKASPSSTKPAKKIPSLFKDAD